MSDEELRRLQREVGDDNLRLRAARVRLNLGWADEPLPQGLSMAHETGVYLWDTRRCFSLEMVRVPEGPFVMGAAHDRDIPGEPRSFENNVPAHEHLIPAPFWISRRTISWSLAAMYCTTVFGYVLPTRAPSESFFNRVRTEAELKTLTAENMDALLPWHLARGFAAWVGLRLPTEGEWEKTARGSNGARCWLDKKGGAQDRLCVEALSPYGAVDVGGGSDEWTCTPYFASAYSWHQSQQKIPGTELFQQQNLVARRVVRGGACAHGKGGCRLTRRQHSYMGQGRQGREHAFRLVLSALQPGDYPASFHRINTQENRGWLRSQRNAFWEPREAEASQFVNAWLDGLRASAARNARNKT